jgi:hypothetical protein
LQCSDGGGNMPLLLLQQLLLNTLHAKTYIRR